MKTAQAEAYLVVLVEDYMTPPPGSLVAHTYGPETILTENNLVRGTSVLLTGPVAEIHTWIRSVGGSVWNSTNPMLGGWTKDSL